MFHESPAPRLTRKKPGYGPIELGPLDGCPISGVAYFRLLHAATALKLIGRFLENRNRLLANQVKQIPLPSQSA